MYTKNDNLQSMISKLIIGALDGGPPCRMSNFRNGNAGMPVTDNYFRGKSKYGIKGALIMFLEVKSKLIHL